MSPRRGSSVPADCSRSSGAARAWRCSFGSSPSVRLNAWGLPSRTISSLIEEPGAMAPMRLARSRASLTVLPSTETITSPALMPALTAGLPACGSATSAPSAFCRPRVSAMSSVTG